jgi:hypothetical protein
MTGADVKTMAEEILGGDTINETFFYYVLNSVKDRIEDERPWMFLRKLDSSLTATPGNGYTTSNALPTDWRRTYKLLVGEDRQYTQIPFDQQHLYRNSANYFVVDVANSVYYLLGNIGQAETIYHYYIKTTDDIASGTSWTAPSRFHQLLAFEVAGYIQVGQDADDIFARMSPENKAQALLIRNSMQNWDMQLQLDAQSDQLQVTGAPAPLDIGTL